MSSKKKKSQPKKKNGTKQNNAPVKKAHPSKNEQAKKLPDKKNTAPEKKRPDVNGDDRIEITKSIFEVNKELRQKELEEQEAKQEELRRKYLEHEKKRQEAYDRRILEEKKELIRMKQGIIEESEMIPEAPEEVVVLTPWKKITNFFYHNKWWLGIGVIFAALAVFLIVNLAKKPRPDVVILVIANNGEVGINDELAEYVESFAEDFNGNGEVLVDVHYIPLSDNHMLNYQNGTDNKLTYELQSADGVIVIGDSNFLELIDKDKTLVDMKEFFPDNKNILGGSFALKHTAFAERIGIDDYFISNDMFIGMRKPQKLLYTDEDEMQEVFDKCFPVYEKIIEDLS